LAPAQIKDLLASLDQAQAAALLHDWDLWRRDNQSEPTGDWSYWLNLGGRGSGKTRTGAEWIRAQVKAGVKRLAMIGPTAADVRKVMVEGVSGVLACAYDGDRDVHGELIGRPQYQPGNTRITWANGAVALLFSAEKPDGLRGPNHEAAWCDELAAWRYPDTWDQLLFGLRLGNPRAVITTTPRPTKVMRTIMADPACRITRSATFDNEAFLAAKYLETLRTKYEGTRLGRQEIYAEMLDDTPGALWTRRTLEACTLKAAPPLKRIVVAIDPAATSTEASNETGIVVAGKGPDGHGYVIDDASLQGTPDEWGRVAVAAYDRHKADLIVAESNQGGEMVGLVIRTAAAAMHREGLRKTAEIPVRLVHASRGKYIRAEPISALYEQGRVHHVGSMATLEDQMCTFTADQDRGSSSPDRLDALVWGLTEIMLTNDAPIVAPVGIGSGPSAWRS
jgi:phage terminase large subunit-like protein